MKIKCDESFKNKLFSIIYLTKIDKSLNDLASNSIGLLNYANVCLSNKDFSNISINNANLNYSIL